MTTPGAAPPPPELLRDLLPRVSRSFSLSVAILPRTLREPIGLAYLLARAADTVADTRIIARGERLRHLETLRHAFAGEVASARSVADACAAAQTGAPERELLVRVPEALDRIAALAPVDLQLVRDVLATITAGQIFDLERFPGDDAAGLAALPTAADLDRYTYLVAGCVGEFWTGLHLAHRPALRAWDRAAMSALGVRFGKALQMTNVLRDVPEDLRTGRCYLPRDELAALSLAPADLLDPTRAARARPLWRRLLDVTLEHYEGAWRYTLAIPRREWRMRLACAWPLLIGVETLRALATLPDPLAAQPSTMKISRADVRRIVRRSLTRVWSNRAMAAEAARLRRAIPTAAMSSPTTLA